MSILNRFKSAMQKTPSTHHEQISFMRETKAELI